MIEYSKITIIAITKIIYKKHNAEYTEMTYIVWLHEMQETSERYIQSSYRPLEHFI